jgi:hypothetical protein
MFTEAHQDVLSPGRQTELPNTVPLWVGSLLLVVMELIRKPPEPSGTTALPLGVLAVASMLPFGSLTLTLSHRTRWLQSL